MFTLVLAFLPLIFTQPLLDQVSENTINIHSNFKKDSIKCNLFDEGAYCQQITIDQRMSLVAVSHRCSCPDGYRCPADIEDTLDATHCERDEERLYFRCHMRCTPKE